MHAVPMPAFAPIPSSAGVSSLNSVHHQFLPANGYPAANMTQMGTVPIISAVMQTSFAIYADSLVHLSANPTVNTSSPSRNGT